MSQTIKIADILAEDRLRPVEQAVVEAYAGIAEERVARGLSPLMEPIAVRPFDDPRYELISGAHRLAALALIGREEVAVGAEVIIRDEDAVAARGSEIMENLARADMTALDRAIFIHEAKNLLVARNPAGGRPRKDVEFKEKKTVRNPDGFRRLASRRRSRSVSALAARRCLKPISSPPRSKPRPTSSPICAARCRRTMRRN